MQSTRYVAFPYDSIRLWFEADGFPWLVLGMQPNQWGMVKCRNLITGNVGWFPRYAVIKGVKII